MEPLHYPNESAEYRAARNALLDDEIALPRKADIAQIVDRDEPARISMARRCVG
jgi:predicted dithiol-disulfide oxidoreductase (DUF899 family)